MTKVEGVFAMEGGEITGLITWWFWEDACEIASLDSLLEGRGVGTALLDRARQAAMARGCGRLTLITTNDNIRAIRFYQKRGFDMARLFRNARERSRQLKPSIPLIGEEGIPLRHELEFEMML